MAKPKVTALQAAAASEDNEKKTRGILTAVLGALGLGEKNAGKAAAKMTKVVEKYSEKRERMEEQPSNAEEEEEGTGSSSAEEEEGSTGSTGTDGESTGSTHSESEEEEEEERGAKGKAKHAESEEEEERATAKAIAKAYRSPAVRDAFLAALPENLREVGALYQPARLSSAARKATGAKSTYGAMHAFSSAKANAADKDAALVTRLAEVEQKAAKATATAASVKRENRKARVAAMVSVAKENGKAASHDLREQLRAYGMEHGTSKLSALIATLPAVRTERSARTPKADANGAPIGAPERSEQAKVMETIFAGLPEKERAAAEKDFNARMANGAPASPRS